MTTTLSIEGVFWFYGAVCIGGVFFVFKVPPETKVLIDHIALYLGLKPAPPSLYFVTHMSIGSHS